MTTFDTPEPISVSVELGVGDIRIRAGDHADTSVEVHPSDPAKTADVNAAEQTRVEYTGGRLLIAAPKGWRQYTPWGGRESIDVEIDLPAGSQVRGEAAVAALRGTGRLGELRYKTGAGEIHIEQAGPVQLRTGAGDVTIDQADGHAEIATGSGAVQIDLIDGSAVIKNSNGDTWIGEVTGDLRANAANGKIAVGRARAAVAGKTANGDIRFGGVACGQILAETGFGKVDIGVLHGVAAWLDLDTRFGRVQSDLDRTERPASGEDAVEVCARTAYGDITVRRSSGDGAGGEAS